MLQPTLRHDEGGRDAPGGCGGCSGRPGVAPEEIAVSALSAQELEVLARRVRGNDWKSVSAAMGLPIAALSKYQERALEKLAAVDLTSLEGLRTVAENVFAVFGQTPDGRPVTLPRMMRREDLRALRSAYATQAHDPEPDLLGKPIDNSDERSPMIATLLASVPSAGTGADVTVRVLTERFVETDEIGVVIFSRVGGALFNDDAIRIGVV